MLQKFLRTAHRAEPWIRRSLALGLFVVMGGAFAHAATLGQDMRQFVVGAVQQAAPDVRNLTPVQPTIVWEGADIDGDGAQDFANPTGGMAREHDAFGSGAFGASRDGGSRSHEGVDYVAVAGQDVDAPISGFVSRIGYAYPGDTHLRYVEITNPALDYAARAFYVAPTVELGQAVVLGQPIGKAESLQARYGGITDHVHLEIIKAGQRLNAETLITARQEFGPKRG